MFTGISAHNVFLGWLNNELLCRKKDFVSEKYVRIMHFHKKRET